MRRKDKREMRKKKRREGKEKTGGEKINSGLDGQRRRRRRQKERRRKRKKGNNREKERNRDQLPWSMLRSQSMLFSLIASIQFTQSVHSRNATSQHTLQREKHQEEGRERDGGGVEESDNSLLIC